MDMGKLQNTEGKHITSSNGKSCREKRIVAAHQPGRHSLVLQQTTSSSSNPEKKLVFGKWMEKLKGLFPFCQKTGFSLSD